MSTGSVINCYNTGTVIGQNKIGGIAGYSYSTIQNCYNTGAVTGDVNTVGGVTGHKAKWCWKIVIIAVR